MDFNIAEIDLNIAKIDFNIEKIDSNMKNNFNAEKDINMKWIG